LESEMQRDEEKMDFEKAAELRNMIEDLRSTTRPTRRFTRGSLPSAIDPMADVHALADALRLPDSPRVMECFDISNISTTHVVASMVCFRDGVPDKNNYRRYRVRTVEGQDDFASMAEVVRRRYSRILLEARAANSDAAEFSQETAFNAARRLEREAIQQSAIRNPKSYIRLPDLIIVDDCPGVSQNRKNLLLRRFGSVNRLRKASVEKIAATEGIGRKLAEEVHRFLEQH